MGTDHLREWDSPEQLELLLISRGFSKRNAALLISALTTCKRVLKTPYAKRNRPDGTSEGTALRAINAVMSKTGA